MENNDFLTTSSVSCHIIVIEIIGFFIRVVLFCFFFHNDDYEPNHVACFVSFYLFFNYFDFKNISIDEDNLLIRI